ncbi:MAG: DNA repair protein RecN [Desulfobacterales bacterium]|jgi:DNA repair protein RecN (Recombination protein N)|nr:DNA repair protein RecN [Desulfobacter sp.]MDP6394749.1 DNA repair protein RecN [Desulfobacterales bacterium]MDP6681555.1 DNA repair protein RecN [Desulfobacterales bacterium]MDP6806825.1 DNA repair protein RecN [Desulfobacterales bacterium]|tara:strand:+ start:107151 stop:108857 length:1707 start_codon:yes stop_codon:yes gene_type:complete
MLQELSIRNFAIIDDLHIHFSKGLTILTGETGAGKSIIIDAVNLLLGSRASSRLIRTGAETAELEALFEVVPKSNIAEIMESNGYNSVEGLLIRRIISRNERHRIYINGRMATIQVLTLITENLASISGQYEHQRLLKDHQQLIILDQFGGLLPLREKIFNIFNEIVPLIQKLKNLKTKEGRQSEHVGLLQFQKQEILDASITAGEDSAIEQERIRLKHGETLYKAVHDSIEALYGAPGAIVERLGETTKELERACQIDPNLWSEAEKISDTTHRIEDTVDALRSYLKNIEIDDQRLEAVEARLDTLQKLKRKYGGSLDAVSQHLESIEHELLGIENISETIAEIEAELSKRHLILADSSQRLSEKRLQTAKALSQKMEKELATLKMPQTKFDVSIGCITADPNRDPHLVLNKNCIDKTGIDHATFMIAPNVGESLKPLSDIASGGELSRVVLSLKAILARTESLETIVFDEVDAGIGGGVAEVVGKKLSSLARFHQIICITHLPQIAVFGNHHFLIAKHVSKGRTKTTIEPVNEKERVKEIARMLSGAKITRATLDHAGEMLAKAHQ